MKKSNKENFINQAIEKHGIKYDYSLVNYINNNTKVKILCPIHGVFEQVPRTHVSGKGHGCGKCANNDYKYTLEDFMKRAHKIHNNQYSYNLIMHVNRRAHINIICPSHGIFTTRADIHLEGVGCKQCRQEKEFKIYEISFLERGNKIHNKLYDYSLVKYIGSNNAVQIICPTHGVFNQTPHNHLRGAGCSSCNESKGEKIIKKFLDENNIVFEREKSFSECRYKYPLPFDFYLPKYNLCIEFNGRQHYKPIKFFGGSEYLKLIQIRDSIKHEYCKKNNIQLLIIKYNDNVIKTLRSYLYTNGVSSRLPN